MSFQIRRAEYFYTTVEDQPGQAFRVLSTLSSAGIQLLAFTGIPIGVNRTQLTIFPEDIRMMRDVAGKVGLTLDGPYSALLAHGDDELGAIAGIHERLAEANVNVFASSGVTDARGAFGYVLYVRPEDFERAMAALEM